MEVCVNVGVEARRTETGALEVLLTRETGVGLMGKSHRELFELPPGPAADIFEHHIWKMSING